MTAKSTTCRRAGARPEGPAPAAPARMVGVKLAPEEEAEIVAGLAEGETLSDLLRVGALQLVRSRNA